LKTAGTSASASSVNLAEDARPLALVLIVSMGRAAGYLALASAGGGSTLTIIPEEFASTRSPGIIFAISAGRPSSSPQPRPEYGVAVDCRSLLDAIGFSA